MRRLPLALLVVGVLGGAPLVAQETRGAAQAGADTAWVGTHVHEARWLYERERPGLAPLRESRLTLVFLLLRTEAGWVVLSVGERVT